MRINNRNLCDFCFSPVEPGRVCRKCGLTYETYQTDADMLRLGTNLCGKYIIGRILGRGGFGATYLAYSSSLGRAVAIKEYFPNGIACRGKGEERISIVSDEKRIVFQRGAKRFFDEAKTMSQFNGLENVVNVYEFFYANDTAYYSMEYLEGIDLKGYVEERGGRISEPEAVTVMRDVCKALVEIHSTGTLHRDISPDNVFICTNGTVKLIDFGAAKQVVGEQSQNLSIILKQGFAPMEQYQKGGNQGMWTDIYAVGATIYYALSGRIPPDAMSRMENPNIQFSADLGISPEFTRVIDKCMRMKIDERYRYARDVLKGLDDLNIKGAPVGGDRFVQRIYTGNNETGLGGNNVDFNNNNNNNNNGNNMNNGNFNNVQQGYNPMENGQGGYYPQGQQMPQSNYYPNSQQVPQSAYYPPQPAPYQKKSNAKLIRTIIIIAAILFVIGMLVTMIIEIMKPAKVEAAEYTAQTYSITETPAYDPADAFSY